MLMASLFNIEPWEVFNQLRPGTLVLARASLVCWVMKEDKGTKKIGSHCLI